MEQSPRARHGGSRTEPRQPEARARRDRPLRAPGRDRARPAAGGAPSARSPRTSAGTRRSGRSACARMARSCRCRTARARGSASSSASRASSGRGSCLGARPGDGRGRGGAYDAPGASGGRCASSRTSASTPRSGGGSTAGMPGIAAAPRPTETDAAVAAATVRAGPDRELASCRVAAAPCVPSIFGISDGLVTNLSLVMGVVGASKADDQLIVLAGVAGLLAGAFSMARGRVHQHAEPARALRAADRARTRGAAV